MAFCSGLYCQKKKGKMRESLAVCISFSNLPILIENAIQSGVRNHHLFWSQVWPVFTKILSAECTFIVLSKELYDSKQTSEIGMPPH